MESRYSLDNGDGYVEKSGRAHILVFGPYPDIHVDVSNSRYVSYNVTVEKRGNPHCHGHTWITCREYGLRRLISGFYTISTATIKIS